MDSFIKKIFDKKEDNFVHIQLQKFSKGLFKNKALIKASKSGSNYSINTTAEYANELVRSVAELLDDGQKVKTIGIIVSTRDLSNELSFKNKKQFMGIKQYVIDSEMTKKQIIEICDKFPASFIGLSFSVNGTELKIKPKAPKSAKPSKKEDGKFKVDFCKIKTGNEKLVRSLLFDVSEFKKVEIFHDFEITGLDIPKNESDPLKMRENTVRNGKLVRKLVVDGKNIEKVVEFSA